MPDYPVTTLAAVEREFTRLTAPPTSLALDGAQLSHGLPPHPIPLDDLRMILLKRQTGWPLKDAVWAELASRAQNQGEPWTTAAIGMMLPALKKIAGDTARNFRGEIADFDSEIVEGFLYALRTLDARAPRIYSSLYFMARRYGQEARSNAERAKSRAEEYDETVATRYRRNMDGHPDLLLARAVLDHDLSTEEADLISRVYLDGKPTPVVARERGVSPYLMRRQLAKAESRLVQYLSDAPPAA